jgi:hypothetical protein
MGCNSCRWKARYELRMVQWRSFARMRRSKGANEKWTGKALRACIAWNSGLADNWTGLKLSNVDFFLGWN